MRNQVLRAVILFGLVAACAAAQGLPGIAAANDPFGQFFQKLTASVVGIVGDVLILVAIWKLLESHQRGAGIVVGILAALVNVYALKHYQDIINWL